MKLRNKKTGVRGRGINTISRSDPETKEERVEMFVVYEVVGTVNEQDREIPHYYGSLAELCKEWEDYKPIEPLIKDEKIRKAIRAWAVACDVKICHYDGDGDFATRWYGIKLSRSQIKLDDGTYTIAELCGNRKEEE